MFDKGSYIYLEALLAIGTMGCVIERDIELFMNCIDLCIVKQAEVFLSSDESIYFMLTEKGMEILNDITKDEE